MVTPGRQAPYMGALLFGQVLEALAGCPMAQEMAMAGEPGNGIDAQHEYRKLPAVDAVLRSPEAAALAAAYGPDRVAATLRDLLDAARNAIRRGGCAPDPAEWPDRLAASLEAAFQPTLRPAINASGVIVHTNLGRAPLSAAALEAVRRVALGYSNLEYN